MKKKYNNNNNNNNKPFGRIRSVNTFLLLLFVSFFLLPEKSYSQYYELNPNGQSRLYWVVKDKKDLWNTTNGIQKGYLTHQADDYNAVDWNINTEGINDCGKVLLASISGTIMYEIHNDAYNGGFGNQVVIQSDENPEMALRYGHLDQVFVSQGDCIKVGDTLGTIGSTGNSVYCHLHLVMYKNLNANAISRIRNNQRPSTTDYGPATNLSADYLLIEGAEFKPYILAGDWANPETIKVYIDTVTGLNSANANISEIIIDNQNIPLNRISNLSSPGNNEGYYSFDLNLSGFDFAKYQSAANYYGRDIKITVSANGDDYYFLGEKKVLFLKHDMNYIADVDDNDGYSDYIKYVIQNNLMYNGYYNRFESHKDLQRDEAALIIANAAIKLGLINFNTKIGNNAVFDDVGRCNKYFAYIQTLRNEGIISNPLNFRPGEKIKKSELAKLIVDAFNIGAPPINSASLSFLDFSDVQSGDWFYEPISRLANNFLFVNTSWFNFPVSRLISGNDDGTFSPGANINRAEFANFLVMCYMFAEQNLNPQPLNSNTIAASINNCSLIGLNYELTPAPYGQKPNASIGTTSLQTDDTTPIVIAFDTETDQYGNPLHFYWAANGNANIIEDNNSGSRIIYNPPE